MKFAVTSGRSGGMLIKGTMSNVPEHGLFKGFSASGQDVWVNEASYRGQRGIVVSAVGARCGKCFRADGDWSAIANTMVLLPRPGFNRDYLWYVLNDEAFWEKGGSAQPYIRFDESLTRTWNFPSETEQALIADFLDREASKADALVAEYERLIELREEKRIALITEAVTKGLDRTRPMKNSGNAFFGPIPRHWEILPLRRVVAKFVDYRGGTPRKTDSGVRLVTAANVKRGYIDYECSREFMPEEDYTDWMVRGLPKVGDVLLTMEAPLGQSAQVDEPRIGLGQRVMLMKTEERRMRPDYLMWALLSASGQGELLSRATGSTAHGIKASKLREVPVPVPPLDEQKAIVKVIRDACRGIDAMEDKVRQAVALVREHRAALITAAVTGQIDVRTYRAERTRVPA